MKCIKLMDKHRYYTDIQPGGSCYTPYKCNFYRTLHSTLNILNECCQRSRKGVFHDRCWTDVVHWYRGNMQQQCVKSILYYYSMSTLQTPIARWACHASSLWILISIKYRRAYPKLLQNLCLALFSLESEDRELHASAALYVRLRITNVHDGNHVQRTQIHTSAFCISEEKHQFHYMKKRLYSLAAKVKIGEVLAHETRGSVLMKNHVDNKVEEFHQIVDNILDQQRGRTLGTTIRVAKHL